MRASICILLLLCFCGQVELAHTQQLSFNRDVRPILSDRCFHCHGPDADNQDSDFRLDTREHAFEDLGGYAGIVPGNLEESELHLRIRSDDDDNRMPPPEAVRQLTDSEKDILDKWIEQGAKFEQHWSFQPVPKSVSVPKSASPWPRGPIDYFIEHQLDANNLKPNLPAKREQWLRRVTFDLTGLPPTLEELNQFLTDDTKNAYEQVVNRLLATDASAERLTSEWLDVARYSDSYGYQRDDARFVWPYRDWVIQSFKNNKPYDEFVTEQLAGDLFTSPTQDQLVATVFNRLHSHKKEGGVALEEFRMENVADRTQTFAAAFMGLTMECARCHDHKYDPIKTKDYYQLSSFFANIDERGLISYFTNAVPTPATPLFSREQRERLDVLDQVVAGRASIVKHVTSPDIVEPEFEQWLKSLTNSKPGSKTEKEWMPGLVASLSFESFEELPEGEYKNEEGKKISREKIRGIANSIGRLEEDEGESDKGLNKEDGDSQRRDTVWTGVANRLVKGRQGKAILLTGDDPVVLPNIGHYGRHQAFSVSIWLKPREVGERAVIYRRSRGWDDAGSIGYELTKLGSRLSAKLVHFWPGDAICIETEDILEKDKWHHVVVTYDGSSKAAGLSVFVDNVNAGTRVVQDSLTRTITQWGQGYGDFAIGSRYRDRGFKNGEVDELRIFERTLSRPEVGQLYDGRTLSSLLSTAAQGKQLSPRQRNQLQDYFVQAISETAAKARHDLMEKRKERNQYFDKIPAITVMREQATPRPAYVLTRGAYDQHGEEVQADTPGFMLEFPKDAPRNRLGLAKWLTSSQHPLLSRVTVNRYWQMLFGSGLVRTPEDFGLQGELPTHPELLDWLSQDFMESGWDVRHLLKQIVLSSTYRQSSIVDPAKRKRDPENRLLSRGPSQRLSAEMIRDNALAVSQLLNQKTGGPPVKPYDVGLAYKPLPVDKGDGLYRRSLYTFWKRTSPAPVMMTMNANKRDVCRVKREVTASPLQALVLLNGSQFVEASRKLGTNLVSKHGDNVQAIVEEAFQLLVSRRPTPKEVGILVSLFEEQLEEFRAAPESAAGLLKIGDLPAPENIDLPKVAAAAVLVNSILNLDESVRLR